MRSRLLGALSALMLACTGLVGLTAQPAAAACSYTHSNKDSATGYVTASDAAVRSGPLFSCTIYGRAYKGYSVSYDCYTIGDTYNGYSTWTWGYVSAIGKSGWINDALLSNHGSSKFCG
jgi:hypothetical protein